MRFLNLYRHTKKPLRIIVIRKFVAFVVMDSRLPRSSGNLDSGLEQNDGKGSASLPSNCSNQPARQIERPSNVKALTKLRVICKPRE